MFRSDGMAGLPAVGTEGDKSTPPHLVRSVVVVPLPNGRVWVVEPSDQRVIVPEPNWDVVPVIVLPLRSRCVVVVPLPNGRVWVVDPSDQRVIVPEPNGDVVPVIVRPSRVRSVVIVPLPNRRVSVVIPLDQRVTVPEPNGWVVPVRAAAGGRWGGSAAKQTAPRPARTARARNVNMVRMAEPPPEVYAG